MKKTLLLVASLIMGFNYAQSFANGGLSTGATSNSGAAAPAGYTWSELQNNTGNTTEANTTIGWGGTYSSSTASYFLADDFTVPLNEKWEISTIDFFAYQSNYAGTTSPFNTARVNIYSSNPSVSGAVSVYGDDTTNRFASTVDSKIYRISNSKVPTTVPAPLTNRKVWKVTANTPVTLSAGTYWVKYQLQNVVTANAGFLPPVTVIGSRGLPSFNAQQYDLTNDIWVTLVDAGNPATAPDYISDMPFVITYIKTTLGVTETLQYDNRMQVYPNPVKSTFRINNPEKLQITSVEVLDISGRIVKILKGADEFDVSGLAKGTYMLKIKSNDLTKVTKLIKE
ncbi:MAG: T9SS type A sorting domain-containing protein [Weeksellaceae bacterium]|nr:T9SS type A sorting domain-containing protein [Weeksellaceae bacterium]